MTPWVVLAQMLCLLVGTFMAMSSIGLFIAGLFNPKVGTWSQYACASAAAVVAYALYSLAFNNFALPG